MATAARATVFTRVALTAFLETTALPRTTVFAASACWVMEAILFGCVRTVCVRVR